MGTRNILFPTDFSSSSEQAAFYAIELAKRCKATLSLLHCYQTPLMAPLNSSEDLIGESQAHLETRLKKLLTLHDGGELDNTLITTEGAIDETILEQTKAIQADLIVMGTKGEDAEDFMFLGGHTSNVFQNALSPVLTVPIKAPQQAFKRIAYASNLQQDDTSILKFLTWMASLYEAELILAHVKTEKNTLLWSNELLEDKLASLDYDKVSIKELKEEDDVPETIEDFIEKESIDLLAMTTYSSGLMDKLFKQSITKEVFHNAEIPMLIFNKNYESRKI